MERKRQSGMSLLVLVITIIVMLILAGVVIFLLSENNTVEQAHTAKDKTNIYHEKENISLSVVHVVGNKGNGILEKTDNIDLQKTLRENYNNERIDVAILGNKEPSIFRVTYQDTKRDYYVTYTGDVSEEIITKAIVEHKTEDNVIISKDMLDYTKKNTSIASIAMSKENQTKNGYIFKHAIVTKQDGSKVTLGEADSVMLDEVVLKITCVYIKKPVEKPRYTVTLDPGQGSLSGNRTFTGEEGSTVTLPMPTAPSGNVVTFITEGTEIKQETTKAFTGWVLNGPGTLKTSAFVFGKGNATLTAQYSHSGIVLPNADKEGYEFKGWYTELNGGNKIGDAGMQYTPATNQTLYAKFADVTKPVISSLTAKICAFTIDATDAGSGIVAYAYSKNATKPADSAFIPITNTKHLVRDVEGLEENVLYHAWVKDASGNVSEVSSVTTLSRERFTLTIDPKGGSISTTTITGLPGETVNIPAVTTAPAGKKVYYNGNGGASAQASAVTAYSFNKWNLATTQPGSISGNRYTFGSGNAKITAVYDHKGVTLPHVSRAGYTFTGWYTQSLGGNKVGDVGQIYTPYSSTTTLYAQWRDDIAPQVIKVTPDYTSAKFSATDAGSGVSSYCVSAGTAPGTFVQLTQATNNVTDFTVQGLQEGTAYTLWVKDANGNVSSGYTFTTKTRPRYTLSINPGAGTYNGSTSVIGLPGETVTLYNPSTPTGPKVVLHAQGGVCNVTSLTAPVSFTNWTLSGGGSISGNIYTFGSSNATVTANYKTGTVTLPQVTKTGYSFTGWYTSSVGGSKRGNAGTAITLLGNDNLYAQWVDDIKPRVISQSATYNSVTFAAQDSGSGIVAYSVTTSSTVTNFISVSNTGSLNKTVTNLAEGQVYYIRVKDASGNISDVVSVQTPTRPRYTLTLDTNGGTTSGQTTFTGVAGEQVMLPAVTKEGYTVYYNTDQGTVSPSYEKSRWSLDRWKILSGGSGSISRSGNGYVYTFGSKNTTLQADWYHEGVTLPLPVRDGYTFRGWYTRYNTTDPAYYVGMNGNTYVPNAGCTLYASWESQIPTLVPGNNIWFRQDITSWTNWHVNVTISTSATSPFRLQYCTGDPNVAGNWVDGSSLLVNRNCTVYARLTDGKVYSNVVSHNVTNIDKNPPTRPVGRQNLAIARYDSDLGGEIQLTFVNLRDSESGIGEIEIWYKTRGEVNYRKYDDPLNELKFPNGISYIDKKLIYIQDGMFDLRDVYAYAIVKDRAGNKVTSDCAYISMNGQQTQYTPDIIN